MKDKPWTPLSKEPFAPLSQMLVSYLFDYCLHRFLQKRHRFHNEYFQCKNIGLFLGFVKYSNHLHSCRRRNFSCLGRMQAKNHIYHRFCKCCYTVDYGHCNMDHIPIILVSCKRKHNSFHEMIDRR